MPSLGIVAGHLGHAMMSWSGRQAIATPRNERHVQDEMEFQGNS